MGKSVQAVFAFVLSLLVISLPAGAREKETQCAWKGVTSERIDAADAALLAPDDSKAKQAIKTHLPFGMPEDGSDRHGEHMLVQEHYLIWYDDDLRAPLWTAHRLTKTDVSAKLTRADSFRSDPRLAPEQRSECADYQEPIFDQGHMVPNGDMTRGETAMDDTFLMSNMTPQHCAFNRGVWQVLESRIRSWAIETEEPIWVITGTIFDREAPIGRDADDAAWRMKGKKGRRVAIPSAQYKILIKRTGDSYETLTIILPNNYTIHAKSKIPSYIGGHVSTLGAVSQMAGFRFLKEAHVTEVPTLWPSNKKWASPLTANCKPSYPEK